MSSRSFRRERARQNRREQRRAEQRARRVAATGALVGATALFGPAAANADTFTVDNTNDTTTAGACDPGIADDCSLRQAVDDANSNGTGVDVIALSSISGTIRLTEGQIGVTGDVDIQGPGANTLTISGDANGNGVHDLSSYGAAGTVDGDTRIFQFGTTGTTPTGVTASISGLTLSGGTSGVSSKYVPVPSPHFKYSGNSGGAIIAYQSALTLSSVVMTDNQATGSGGAIDAATAGTTPTNNLTITGSDIHGNEAYAGGGGVISSGGQMTVTNSQISGNATDGKESTAGGTTLKYPTGGTPGQGGGILASSIGAATISDSTISDNTAADNPAPTTTSSNADGGGLYVLGSGTSTIQITDTAITGNSGIRNGGGAFITGGTGEIGGSTISGNTLTSGVNSNAWGGGLRFRGDLQLSNSTISGNSLSALTADKGIGGGLYWQAAQRDQGLSVENSTISGNQSSGAGAGAYLFAYSDYDGTAMASFGTGPVSFRNSTIASNTASGAVSSGGGIFEYGYTQASATDPAAVGLSSTIVAGNTPTELGAAGTSSFEAGNSLIQGDVTGIPFTQNPAGSNVLGANPQLGPLKDNGGPTDTHLPGAGSPAIDAGVANGLSTDQRGTGFPRTINDPSVADHSGSDGTDIGAVEAPLHAEPVPGGGTPTTPAPKKCKKKKKHGHKSAQAAKKCKKHKKKKN